MRFRLLSMVYLITAMLLHSQETLEFKAQDRDYEQDIAFRLAALESLMMNSQDSSRIASELVLLGDLYRKVELYSEAMKQFSLAATFLDPISPDTLSVHLKNSIAAIDVRMENYDSARALLKEALLIADNVKYSRGKAISCGLLGICAEKQGDYLAALQYQQKSLDLFHSMADSHGEAMTEENIGSIYEDLGQYDLAYEHFSKAYNYLETIPNSETANLLNNLGDIRRKQGRVGEGMAFTEQALILAGKLGDLHQLESAHKDLSKGFATLGDYPKAFKHLQQADKYRNEALRIRNTRHVNLLQTLYEIDGKESEIRLLREQNKVSTANQQVLGVSVGAMFLLFISLAILITYRRRAERRIRELHEESFKAEYRRIAQEEAELQREVALKSAALTRYSINLAHKDKLLMDLSRSLSNMATRGHMDYGEKLRSWVQEIDHSLNQDNEWDEFMHIFEEIHPDFMKKLNTLAYDNLSPSELRLGMLLRLNLSSKEIASILRVTPDSVRVARYRLRKKLPIEQGKELVNFMVEL